MTSEFDAFNNAMDTILKADPVKVKAAVSAEILENTEDRAVKGQRKRGRKPTSSVDRASNVSDQKAVSPTLPVTSA
jgi:hypothetical protein